MVSEIPQDAIRIMPEPLRQWTTAVLVRLVVGGARWVAPGPAPLGPPVHGTLELLKLERQSPYYIIISLGGGL